MDPDLQLLLQRWLSDDWDSISDVQQSISPMVRRLREDDSFRESFVEELALLGQLRAVQSSEPRWLQLEDLLGVKAEPGTEGDFETLLMQRIDAAPLEPKSHRFRWMPAVLAATVLLASALVIGAWQIGLNGIGPKAVARQSRETAGDSGAAAIHSQVKSPTESIAVLSQMVDARWDGPHRPDVGDSLGTGRLLLSSGTVQIEFFAGVRLLVRAPADFELMAADEVWLRAGVASCFVTEMGRGFKITTSDLEVIDLGTAFSIQAGGGQQSEVHVLDGAVEIKSGGNTAVELTERKAVRATTVGLEAVTYSPDRFPQTADLRDQQLRQATHAYQRWQRQSEEMDADPDVLLHYTFEEADPSALELTNRVVRKSTATDGVVIGCKWAEGRWPMKHALLYRNVNDRVLFQVPGRFDEVTFMAWVRLDGLTQQNTSLLMTENPARRLRFAPIEDKSIADAMQRLQTSAVKTVRWELTRQQSNVTLSIGHGLQNRADYETVRADSVSTRPDRWGHWACMAVTCDVAKQEIVHYLDGAPIGRGKLESSEPLLLDFMELGNFGASMEEITKSNGNSIRRFYGAVDELVIARRAMTAAEIKEFWLHGKP